MNTVMKKMCIYIEIYFKLLFCVMRTLEVTDASWRDVYLLIFSTVSRTTRIPIVIVRYSILYVHV